MKKNKLLKELKRIGKEKVRLLKEENEIIYALATDPTEPPVPPKEDGNG